MEEKDIYQDLTKSQVAKFKKEESAYMGKQTKKQLNIKLKNYERRNI